MYMEPWHDDEVQFARILCEIVATQGELDIDALILAMDLQPSEVDEVFQRAHERWERAKRHLRDLPDHAERTPA